LPAISYISTVVILAIALFVTGCEPETAAPEEPPPPEGTEVGDRIPSLQGTDSDGRAWDFDPARSEYSLLEFYRSGDCGLCRLRLEELETYRDAYEQASVGIYALSPEPPEQLSATMEAVGSGGPAVSVDREALVRLDVIQEPDQPVNPVSYVVDREGVIRYRHIGRNAGDRANDVEILAAIRQDRQRREMAGR